MRIVTGVRSIRSTLTLENTGRILEPEVAIPGIGVLGKALYLQIMEVTSFTGKEVVIS